MLSEPVPGVVEFRPADWAEKYFSAQSAMRSSRVTLSPSYTKQFSSSIYLVAWPVQRKVSEKIFNEAGEIASPDMGAKNQYSSIKFLGRFIEGISIVNFWGYFYTVVFGYGESQSSTSRSLNNFRNFPRCAKCKSPLHGPHNYVDRTWELSANYTARTFLAIAPHQKSLSNCCMEALSH